jgi:hypothetical protein
MMTRPSELMIAVVRFAFSPGFHPHKSLSADIAPSLT